MRIIIKIILIVNCLLFLTFGAMGQVESGNYKIPLSHPVSGGGTSASASYSLTGNSPLTPSGISGSASYQMSGGLVAALFGGVAMANNPPTATCPGDTAIRICDAGEICLPGFSCSDIDGNLATCTVSPGVLDDNSVCFTPTSDGDIEITLIATDTYGAADTCITTVRISRNTPPIAACPGNRTVFVCDSSPICVPGFTASDTNHNIAEKTLIGGSLNGDTACFTPSAGENQLIFIVMDSCGLTDTCKTTITVSFNEPPFATAPNDTSITVWNLDEICYPGFAWGDANNNIQSVTAIGGTLSGASVCFEPVQGVNILKLIVADSCGKSDTAIAKITISPAYTYTPIDTISASGQTIKIASGANDITGTLNYRLGGQTSYTQVVLTPGVGDTLTYTIPASLLTSRGMEYYIQLVKGIKTINIGTSANPYLFVTQMTNEKAQRPSALPEASYRIVSVPIDIAGSNTVQAVFGDDLGAEDKKQWRLGSYNGNTGGYNEYPSAAAVTPEQGYWLIARGGKKYGAEGYSLIPNRQIGTLRYYGVDLDSGWNQLANPLPFDIDWVRVRFDDNGTVAVGHPASVLDDAAYWYNGKAYTFDSLLQAWDGFFVNIKKRGVKVLFPYLEYGVSPTRPIAGQAYFSDNAYIYAVEFSLRANQNEDNHNYAVICSDALDGQDDFDFAEPPMAPEGVSFAFIGIENNSPKRIDARPLSDDGMIWHISISPNSDRHLNIRNIKEMSGNMDAWLVLSDGSEYRLSNEIDIVIPDDIVSARFLVGNADYLKAQGVKGIPSDYALFQNYPNPFNPSTTIRFSLPKSGAVEMDIYNILGQKIRGLIFKDMPAGYHTVIWDGLDDGKREVASGVYFYRLKSGDYEGVRKMMLLK
jgi:hypothetical protein